MLFEGFTFQSLLFLVPLSTNWSQPKIIGIHYCAGTKKLSLVEARKPRPLSELRYYKVISLYFDRNLSLVLQGLSHRRMKTSLDSIVLIQKVRGAALQVMPPRYDSQKLKSCIVQYNT